MKLRQLITATIILLSITGIRAQQQRQISNFDACVSDSIFTLSIYPMITKASDLIKGSNVPAKEAIETLNNLQAIIAYFDKQIEDQKKAEPVADKPKSKAKK